MNIPKYMFHIGSENSCVQFFLFSQESSTHVEDVWQRGYHCICNGLQFPGPYMCYYVMVFLCYWGYASIFLPLKAAVSCVII